MWRMVCFVDNCQVTPRHFGTGQGAMTLAHSLTNLVDFDTLCKWPFDFLQMFCFSIQAAMKNQMILLLNFGIYIRVRFFLSLIINTLQPYGVCSPWNSPGQNTGVGSCSLLQGIFPTQGSNPGPPHCRQILYQLSHQGRPRILEWYPIPSPGELPNPEIEPRSPTLQADSFPAEVPGKQTCH